MSYADFRWTPDADRLQSEFVRGGVSVWPALISQESVASLTAAGLGAPAQRTANGRLDLAAPEHTWEERYQVPHGHVARFFTSGRAIAWIRRVLEPLRLDSAETTVWVNRYVGFETIRPHRDEAGDAQLVVALRQVGEGGELVVEAPAGLRTVSLGPGDGLLFRATHWTHWTTPLRGGTDLERVNVVARYFTKTT